MANPPPTELSGAQSVRYLAGRKPVILWQAATSPATRTGWLVNPPRLQVVTAASADSGLATDGGSALFTGAAWRLPQLPHRS
ncbi:hypothetical protein [Pantoea sp. KPR_PJ]|uniref:hypothetical protein n=1 Tax=Pantoea sp. KPR_PJ TaxID=2738375 RepID=UPI0035286613